MPTIDRTLSNGIRLVMEPIAASNSAAIGFWFPIGSRDEPDGYHGVTHFLEHLIFKGTSSHTSREIALFFDRVGGYINAFTERELMCIMCVVPANIVVEATEIIGEMVYSSLLDSVDIETERSVILSEIFAVYDDPDESGMERALELMYQKHAVSLPITGTIDEIRRLKAETIRSWYHKVITTVPPLVTVAGKFDYSAIEQKIAALRLSISFENNLIEANNPVMTPGFQTRWSPFSQSQLYLSWPVKNLRTSEHWYTWAIINAIAGDTVSSRLFQQLREKDGLCYSVYSFYVFNRDSALWTSCLTTPAEKTTKAIDQLVKELDKIVYNGFTEQEILDAKSHIVGEISLSADDTEYRMKRIARQILFNGSTVDVDKVESIINKIDSQMIQKCVFETFTKAMQSLVVYGPKRAVKGAKKAWK